MAKKRTGRVAEVDIEPPKKIGGASFGIMMGFAMMKDLLDIFLTFISVIPFTVFFVIIGSLLGIIISIAIFFYLFSNRVGWTTKKIVIFAVAFIIEIIPFLGFLPMATLNLFLVTRMENNDRMRTYARLLEELR